MKYILPQLYKSTSLSQISAACNEGQEAVALGCKNGPEAGSGCGSGAAAGQLCLSGAAAGGRCSSGLGFE